MIRLLVIAVFPALAFAKPELYKETEDFQYSRSSSDEGSKSGFYGAQRGNMGGNFEKAHNMDGLAQHQMSGLVRTVDGELGDGYKTRTGSVYSAANSRGVYGSGNYDLSNLQGRSFEETESFGGGSHSSRVSQNSGFRGQTVSESSAHRSSGRAHSSGYRGYMGGEESQQFLQTDHLKSFDNLERAHEYDHGNQAAMYSSSGLQSHRSYDQSNANVEHSGLFEADSSGRIHTATPVRVIVRPGTRVTVPFTAQTYDGSRTASSFDIDRTTLNKESDHVSTNGQTINYRPSITTNPKHYESSYNYRKAWEKYDTQPVSIPVVIPTENPFLAQSEAYDKQLVTNTQNAQKKSNFNVYNSRASNAYTANSKSVASRYQTGSNAQHSNSASLAENINSYTAGRHSSSMDTNNGYDVGSSNSLLTSNTNGYNTNSRNQLLSSSANGYNTNSRNQLLSSSANGYNTDRSLSSASSINGYNTDSRSISSALSANEYNSRAQQSKAGSGIMLGADSSNLVELLNTKPNNYHSSYSYHKSWERQGDPYVIKPASSAAVDGLTSQKLTAASSSRGAYSHHYGSHHEHANQDFSQNGFGSDCDEEGHIRVARSYNPHQGSSQNIDQGQDYEQLSQSHLEDLGQHVQSYWDNLHNLGQETQNQWDNIQDLGQQTQEKFDKLEVLNQQAQNQWDNMQDLNQQPQEKFNELADLSQQTQNQWDNTQDISQQTQEKFNKLEDLGQQIQNQWDNTQDKSQQTQEKFNKLEDLGQQTQNQWDNTQDISQQTQEKFNKLEDLGQQSQNQWDNTQDISQQTQEKFNKLEDLGQQTQNHWDNTQDISQQTQEKFNKLEDLGQQTQNQWDNTQDISQQTQEKFIKLEDLGQQTQNQWDNTQDISQQTQEKFNKLEDLGQQTENQWDNTQDISQQTQEKFTKLEDLGQQTQNQWDNTQDISQQTQEKFNKLEELGQQTQNHWDNTQDISQQTQEKFNKLEDLGQQTQNQWDNTQDISQQTQEKFNKLEDLGQQTQNQWDNTQDISQQTQEKFNKLEDLGQQTQNQWNTEDLGQLAQNKWNTLEHLDKQTISNREQQIQSQGAEDLERKPKLWPDNANQHPERFHNMQQPPNTKFDVHNPNLNNWMQNVFNADNYHNQKMYNTWNTMEGPGIGQEKQYGKQHDKNVNENIESSFTTSYNHENFGFSNNHWHGNSYNNHNHYHNSQTQTEIHTQSEQNVSPLGSFWDKLYGIANDTLKNDNDEDINAQKYLTQEQSVNITDIHEEHNSTPITIEPTPFFSYKDNKIPPMDIGRGDIGPEDTDMFPEASLSSDSNKINNTLRELETLSLSKNLNDATMDGEQQNVRSFNSPSQAEQKMVDFEEKSLKSITTSTDINKLNYENFQRVDKPNLIQTPINGVLEQHFIDRNVPIHYTHPYPMTHFHKNLEQENIGYKPLNEEQYTMNQQIDDFSQQTKELPNLSELENYGSQQQTGWQPENNFKLTSEHYSDSFQPKDLSLKPDEENNNSQNLETLTDENNNKEINKVQKVDAAIVITTPPPKSETEKPGFWKSVGGKLSNAKNKVFSWFGSK